MTRTPMSSSSPPSSAPTPAPMHAHRDVDRTLIDRRRIASRVEAMAAEISRDLSGLDADVEILLVPVMTGALMFVADLIRHLPQKIRIHVVAASSYRGRTTQTSGAPEISGLTGEVGGKHVLIVDDILDSGKTIRAIRAEIERLSPRSVRACVLLRKQLPEAEGTPCEYVGFDIPDEFVVGYGLDYDGYYRNLPDIGVLRQDAL